MADVRINALTTTASSSASDDYVAIDGSANGTRKLSAYSPSFGGNATVGGTLTVSGYGQINGLSTNTSDFRVAHSNTNYAFDVSTKSTGAAVLQLYNSNGTTGVSLSSSASATNTLAGNLTVSGTGTNTLTGSTIVSVDNSNGTQDNFPQFFVQGATDSAKKLRIGYDTTNGYGVIQALQVGVGYKPLVLNPSGGNLLLGTTTDSANGKVQLATHTTSAGGIGFGTDVALYRPAANVLALDSGDALRLGNAYAAGAPTATGYVTIQDSSGTTYKVLVST